MKQLPLALLTLASLSGQTTRKVCQLTGANDRNALAFATGGERSSITGGVTGTDFVADPSCLELPTSDEEANRGGRINHFQDGSIARNPGDAARTVHFH